MSGHRVRTALVYLGMAGMESCWIAVLFSVLVRRMAPHSPAPTAAVVLGLVVLPLGLALLLEWRKVPLRGRQAVLLGGLALLVVLTLVLHVYRMPASGSPLGRGLLAAAVCALIWWRGVSLGQVDLAVPNVVLFNFWVGLLALVLVLLLGPAMAPLAAGPMAELAGADQLLPLFFAAALATLGLARLEEVSRIPQSTPVRFGGGRWIWMTVGLATLIVLAGLALAPFVAGGELARVAAWAWSAIAFPGRVVGGCSLPWLRRSSSSAPSPPGWPAWS